MEKYQSIAFELRNVTNLIRRKFEYMVTSEDMDKLTRMHGWALGYFCENKEHDLFQKDFEQEFSIRPSTATRILQSMEKNGLIKRQPVQYDARIKKIVLTEKAMKLHQQVKKKIKHLEGTLEQGISNDELQTFFKVMKKIRHNLEETC